MGGDSVQPRATSKLEKGEVKAGGGGDDSESGSHAALMSMEGQDKVVKKRRAWQGRGQQHPGTLGGGCWEKDARMED